MTQIILNAIFFDVNLSHEAITSHTNPFNVFKANTSGFRICGKL